MAEHIAADCRWVECLVLAVNPDVGSHQNQTYRTHGGASSFACSSMVLRSAWQSYLHPGMLLHHMAALPGFHWERDGTRHHPLCQNLVSSVGGDLRPLVAGQKCYIDFAVLESPEHCHTGLVGRDRSDCMPYRGL